MQGRSDLLDDPDCTGGMERAVPQKFLEIAAGDPAHCHVQPPPDLAEVVDGHHVGSSRPAAALASRRGHATPASGNDRTSCPPPSLLSAASRQTVNDIAQGQTRSHLTAAEASAATTRMFPRLSAPGGSNLFYHNGFEERESRSDMPPVRQEASTGPDEPALHADTRIVCASPTTRSTSIGSTVNSRERIAPR
jgi:hypothetical protein